MNLDQIESLKKKARRPIPLRGFEQKLYAAVVLSVALGVAWSIAASDWQYFERSGSLVILAAITMAWRDHVQLLGKVERFYQSEFKRRLSECEASRPRGLMAANAPDTRREEIEATASSFDELMSLLKRRLRTTEAVVLGLGTFVWGYGAPIGNLLWSLK
jgi:hypothetical protein